MAHSNIPSLYSSITPSLQKDLGAASRGSAKPSRQGPDFLTLGAFPIIGICRNTVNELRRRWGWEKTIVSGHYLYRQSHCFWTWPRGPGFSSSNKKGRVL